MYVLLTILLFVGYVIAVPIGLLFGTIDAIKNKNTNGYYKGVAIGGDVWLNIVCAVSLNFLFITKDGFKFGNKLLTISQTLRANMELGTCNKLGLRMCKILIFFNDSAFV